MPSKTQHRTQTNVRQRDDDNTFILIFSEFPPKFDWQDVKDAVRCAGVRYVNRAHIFEPDPDGIIYVIGTVRGREDANRAYEHFVNNGFKGNTISVGLGQKRGEEVQLIRPARRSPVRGTNQLTSHQRDNEKDGNDDTSRRMMMKMATSMATSGYDTMRTNGSNPVTSPMHPLQFASTPGYQVHTNTLGRRNQQPNLVTYTNPSQVINEYRFDGSSSCSVTNPYNQFSGGNAAATAAHSRRPPREFRCRPTQESLNMNSSLRYGMRTTNVSRPRAASLVPASQPKLRQGPLIVDGSQFSARRTQVYPDSDEENDFNSYEDSSDTTSTASKQSITIH